MIKSQFSYCPLIWMFSSQQFNKLMYKIHERPLSLIKWWENRSFEILLQNNKDITIHQINLLILITEIYNIVKAEAPAIMKNLFAIELLICGKVFQKNINIRILQGNFKKIKKCETCICRLCRTDEQT